ncbi:unnamed protein product [Rotaria sp. Silwood2]|nr:unnamed protein product [Rotaria sp. Silwood2]
MHFYIPPSTTKTLPLTHPALGGGFGPGYKFRFGYDFVGDYYSGDNTPVPDSDPYDCNGHGTHVSGTIGSNGPVFIGVAPNATLSMYRVFGCSGYTTTDVLIAAYGAAFKNGAHIITASMGGPSGWPDDAWAIVISRIVKAGVSCTVAAGNDGNEGLFYGSSGASAIGAIAVASIDNLGSPELGYQGEFYVQLGPKLNFHYLAGFNNFPSTISGYALYAFGLKNINSTDACSPLPSETESFSEKIVLIRLGNCWIWEQLDNLKKIGAKYVMFYISVDSTDYWDSFDETIVGVVSKQQGITWLSYLKQGLSVKLYFSSNPPPGVVDWPNTDTGGKISKFSSWYPTNDLNVKPEIAAPGGNILSTYPSNMGAYAVLSGTSMATPYIAGVLALYLHAKGFQEKVNSLVLRDILITTATPVFFNDGSINYPNLAPVAQQGGGLVDAFAAVKSVTRFSLSTIALNDTANFKKQVKFTITNTGSATVSYQLYHRRAATAYAFSKYWNIPQRFPPELILQYASVWISPSTVTLSRKNKTTITITFTAPTGLNIQRIPVYSGYIAIKGNNGESFQIPYTGVACEMKKINLIDSTLSEPSLHYYLFEFYTAPVVAYQTIDLKLYPLVYLFNLVMPSKLVRLDILGKGKQINVAGVNILGSAANYPYYSWPRSSSDELSEAFWNGTLSTGVRVPPGNYSMLLRVLKLFGNPNNANDYERWQSPMFNIVY